MSDTFDLAIVGGGPAGQAAALEAVAAGLRVVMLDEQARMGGQILRQPPRAMRVPDWLTGRSYRALHRQLAAAEALAAIDWRGRTSVLGITARRDGAAGFTLVTAAVDGQSSARLDARRVLVAAGCYDLPVPLPGWTTPGVMSAGAIQAFIKSQQLVPGDRFVLSGTHPLQIVLADQIVAGGGRVAAVLFAQSRSAMLSAFVAQPLALLGNMAALVDAASAMRRLRRAGVPVLFGQHVAAIIGEDAVTAARIGGAKHERTIACDRVGLCFGFLPQSDLPRSLGATMHWVAPTGGWRTEADAWQRASIAGLYVAGETTGVAGAPAAMAAGRIAGIAIAQDAGCITPVEAEARARPMRARLKRLLAFASALDAAAAPTRFLDALPDADTIVCRCEDVRLGTLQACLASATTPGTPNALKLVSRAGMGVCQGRGCEAAVLRATARARGVDAAMLSGFTPRMPIRPVPIRLLRED